MPIALTDKLVVATAGYTASGKTAVASLLASYAGFEAFELSDVVYASLARQAKPPTADAILLEIARIRAAEGPGALATRLVPQVNKSGSDRVVVAGLRSTWDVDVLRSVFKNFFLLYIHVTTQLRHQYIQEDPASLHWRQEDMAHVDRAASLELIRETATSADGLIINEPGYPQTPLEQVKSVMNGLALRNPGHEFPWRPTAWPELEVVDSPAAGIRRVAIPHPLYPEIYLRLMSYAPWKYHPESTQPHFHEVSEEVAFLPNSTGTAYCKRGYLPGDDVVKVRLPFGVGVSILPGWTHWIESDSDERSVHLLRPTEPRTESHPLDEVV